MTDGAAELAPGVWQIEQRMGEELSLFLHVITGPEGLAVVDGGLPASLPFITELITTAGGEVADIRYLLNSHAHHDHIGTFAELRQRSGATLIAPTGGVRWIEDLEINISEFALHRPDIIADNAELRASLASTYSNPTRVDISGGLLHVYLGGGKVLESIELPGHVTAELGWFERSSRTLILGDAVTGTAWSLFHGHLLPTEFRRTLHRLRAFALDEQVELVCLSHYAPHDRSDFLELLQTVERYLDDVTATVEGQVANQPATVEQVWRGTCAAMGKILEFRGLAMVEAHLREAVAAGRLREVGPDTFVSTGR